MTEKAVIVAGGSNNTGTERPLVLWPLINYSILEHLIRRLSEEGIRNIIVSISNLLDETHVLHRLKKATLPETSIILHKEKIHNRGTAGCLKELENFFSGEDAFLLVTGSVFLNGMNLENLFRLHREKGALITAYVCSMGDVKISLE